MINAVAVEPAALKAKAGVGSSNNITPLRDTDLVFVNELIILQKIETDFASFVSVMVGLNSECMGSHEALKELHYDLLK